MNSNILEKFQAAVAEPLTEGDLEHMQRLASSVSNKSPTLKKHEVLKLGMYSMPLSELPHEGTQIDEIDGLPVLWIGALGAYAVKDDPKAFVINTCHPYRQAALKDARALHS